MEANTVEACLTRLQHERLTPAWGNICPVLPKGMVMAGLHLGLHMWAERVLICQPFHVSHHLQRTFYPQEEITQF